VPSPALELCRQRQFAIEAAFTVINPPLVAIVGFGTAILVAATVVTATLLGDHRARTRIENDPSIHARA